MNQPPDPSFRLPEVSIFDVMEGELTLEGLDFQIVGRRDSAESRRLSAVRLSNAASCHFRRCVVTLDEAEERAAAAVLDGSEGDRKRAAFATGTPINGPARSWSSDCPACARG